MSIHDLTGALVRLRGQWRLIDETAGEYCAFNEIFYVKCKEPDDVYKYIVVDSLFVERTVRIGPAWFDFVDILC